VVWWGASTAEPDAQQPEQMLRRAAMFVKRATRYTTAFAFAAV